MLRQDGVKPEGLVTRLAEVGRRAGRHRRP